MKCPICQVKIEGDKAKTVNTVCFVCAIEVWKLVNDSMGLVPELVKKK